MNQFELIKLMKTKIPNKTQKEVECQVKEFFKTIKAAITNGFS